MLGTSDGFSQFPGFRTAVDNVRGKTASAAFWYDLPYYAAYLLDVLATVAVILIPLLLILIYHRYGREKEFTVPAYLSTLPSTALKPWQVNLLFKGDALDFDEDGYYATLLDLHRRKNIAITEKGDGKGVEIRVLSSAEPRSLRAEGPHVHRPGRGKRRAGHREDCRTCEAGAVRQQCGRDRPPLPAQLTDVTSRVDTSSRHAVHGGWPGPHHPAGNGCRRPVRHHRDPCPCLLHAVVHPLPGSRLWVVVLVQAGIAFAAPSTLFGHWKDDRYKEKLEWDSFTHFLSDMAMIQKYAPADLSMWGDWLIYGTALGVGRTWRRR